MDEKLESINILGIRADKVNMVTACKKICGWLSENSKKKRYVVTTNVEFIMAAQKDEDFKRILTQADLSVPDSARLPWAVEEIKAKDWAKKLLIWPFFWLPTLISTLPIVRGVDLLESLCQKSAEKGFTVGFLGGRGGVTIKTAECLKKKYPGLKVALADDGPIVDKEGNVVGTYIFPDTEVDILFVGFGQVKQEKWIDKSLPLLPVKIAMGVGGSFDYLSGQVKRAPWWMRRLGLEWLFRLLLQPWRIKRFGALVKFVFLVPFYKSSNS